MSFNPLVHQLHDEAEASELLRQINVEQRGVPILAAKAIFQGVKLHGVRSPAANIMKQEMLSLGGDVAVADGVVNCSVERSDVLVMGTKRQLHTLVKRLRKNTAFELKELAAQMGEALEAYAWEPAEIRCGRHTLSLASHTHIMGVINVTSDSFYQGNCYLDPGAAVEAGLRMEDEGADIIDVGGESTRPGADPLGTEEELSRVLPVVERLVKEASVPISVDTYKAEVAKQVLDAGVDLINDISGLSFDSHLAADVARYDVGVIISHIRGVPKTMQENPRYEDLLGEIMAELRGRCEDAAEWGIPPSQMIVDPGIGFGKTTDHNLRLIKHLHILKVLRKPILIGVSRKAFLGQLLGVPAEERLIGTLAAVAMSIQQGASIVRVHDVREVMQVARVVDAIRRGSAEIPGAAGLSLPGGKPQEERGGKTLR